MSFLRLRATPARDVRFRARVLCATRARRSARVFALPVKITSRGEIRECDAGRDSARHVARPLALAFAKVKNATRFCDVRANAQRSIGGFNNDRTQIRAS